MEFFEVKIAVLENRACHHRMHREKRPTFALPKPRRFAKKFDQLSEGKVVGPAATTP